MCAKVVEYPFDTVKVRMQTAEPGMYTGPVDVFQKALKSEGFLSLYRGLLSPPVLTTRHVFA